MTMAGGTGPGISRPLTPSRDVPGVIGRLLQGTPSTTRTSKRLGLYRGRTRSPAALRDQLLVQAQEGALDPTASRDPAARQQSRSTASDAGNITQPQPQQICAKQTAPPATLEMPSATPQPQLKKKASFRERLRAWQKPPPQPLELVAEESKPRFVYEPRHAAADFSRLAVSPLSPSRQRLASPIHGLAGNDAAFVRRTSQSRPKHGDENRIRSPRDEQSEKRHSRSGANRDSYTLVEDPFQDPNAAAHIPVHDQPVVWSLGARSAAPREEEEPPAPPAAQPLSDYELFIARAEAEERERREKVLRSISQRSAAYSASRVKPDPHRQFATAAGSPPAERSQRPQRHDSGSPYILGSGREQPAPAPAPQKPAPEQQQRQEGRRRGGPGHARQPSWAPSYATSGSATKSPVSPPQAQAQPPQRRPPGNSVEEDPGGGRVREYQPQPPRTLRRQASLTQRIAQYIRPPKGSRMRAAETLVE